MTREALLRLLLALLVVALFLIRPPSYREEWASQHCTHAGLRWKCDDGREYAWDDLPMEPVAVRSAGKQP
jgi:hypothetical protein